MIKKTLLALLVPLAAACAVDPSSAVEGPIGTQSSALCKAKEPTRTERFEIVSLTRQGREVKITELTRAERVSLDGASRLLASRDGAVEAKCDGYTSGGNWTWACSDGESYCYCVHYSDGPSCACTDANEQC